MWLKMNNKWIAAVAFGCLTSVLATSISTTCQAQCASGNCGNVGSPDGFGGYASHGYGSSYSSSSYGNYGHRQVQPLFENYFTQGHANQADAALYISPTGVPGNVGHTFVTYEPFYPHHYLYQHKDRYHSYYDDGFGLNRTKAHYYAPPVRTAANRLYRAIELPRQ